MLKKKIMFLLCTSLLAVTAFADITFYWKVSYVRQGYETRPKRRTANRGRRRTDQPIQWNDQLAEGITIDPAKAVVTTDTSFLIANTNKNAVRVVDGGKKINLAFANALPVATTQSLLNQQQKHWSHWKLNLMKQVRFGRYLQWFWLFTVKVYDPETNTTKTVLLLAPTSTSTMSTHSRSRRLALTLAQTTENVNLTIEATDANLFEAKYERCGATWSPPPP